MEFARQILGGTLTVFAIAGMLSTEWA